MERTEDQAPSRGAWIIRKGGLWASYFSLPVFLLLLIATYARATAALASVLIFTAGCLEWSRGRHRLRNKDYRPLRRDIEVEVGLARLQMSGSILLLGAALAWSPELTVGTGFVATLFLLFKSAALSGPLSEEEERRDLLKQTAAEECGLIGKWAKNASRVRKIPGFGLIPEAAHQRAPEEHISALRTVSMMVLFCACASYFLTGVALGITSVAPLPSLTLPSVPGVPPVGIESTEGDGRTDPPPTYAELCEEIRDPLSIGHQLGPLFRRDGAIKAGCATEPFRIAGTGTWVSAGDCEGELRSLAVSAPGYEPAIIYGTPARFALAAAHAGKLVGLEVAKPNDGDVYLVVTRDGTFAFTRPTRSLEKGSDNPQSCSEVGGRARPFARLEPVMVNLWSELMQLREEWVWPKLRSEESQSLAFTDRFDASRVAEGSCDGSEQCWIESGEGVWSQEGSGFVSLIEISTYMPSDGG